MSQVPVGPIAMFALLLFGQLTAQINKNNTLAGLSSSVLALLAWDPERVHKAEYVLAANLAVLAHQLYVRTERKPFKVRINRGRLRRSAHVYPIE